MTSRRVDGRVIDAIEADPGDIRRSLDLLLASGEVAELRVLATSKGTVAGYFTDREKMAAAASQWSGQGDGVFMTLNPVRGDLLARANNRAAPYAKHTTGDKDIVRRRWLPVDCDPARPAGIPSTDAEHAAALARAREVRERLRQRRWPEPVLADSGNGGHLLYRVDLANDDASRNLVQRCTDALAFRFSDKAVSVDAKTANAARVWKLYGTLASKGDGTAQRPRRWARLLDVPDELEVVAPDLLEAIGGTVPSQTRPAPSSNGRRPFDLDAWIATHHLPVIRTGDWNGGRKFLLNPCPWNADHRDVAAYIVQFSNGALAAGCHHNGCAGKGWHELRDRYEPGWRNGLGAQAPVSKLDHLNPNTPGHLRHVRLSDVEPQTVSWLWDPYLPLGKLALLEGDPGVGKSWVALALATAVSLGRGLPGTVPFEPATVLLLSAEDGLGDTIRPRLDQMGADVSRIVAIPDAVTLDAAGLEDLEAKVAEVRPSLVIIDPLVAYMGGGVDLHRANETRAMMAPLGVIAERHVCVLLGIRHLSKSEKQRSIYRGLGSIDLTAACRSVLLAGCDPDDPQKRALVQVKSNLAAAGRAQGYAIDAGGRFRWTGVSDLTDTRILGPATEQSGALNDAESFLLEALAEGARLVPDVEREAKHAGISSATLRRAKYSLGVRSHPIRTSGEAGIRGWEWVLPARQGSLGDHTLPRRDDDHLNRVESNDLVATTDGDHLNPVGS